MADPDAPYRLGTLAWERAVDHPRLLAPPVAAALAAWAVRAPGEAAQVRVATPIGLPPRWRLLLDEEVATGTAIIGSGVRRSKIVLPGALLARLPGAEVVAGLGTP